MKAALSPTYSKGTLPQTASFLSIEPSTVIMSALKVADDGSGLILRVYNPTSKDLEAKIVCSQKPVKKAGIVNFLEEPKSELEVDSTGAVKLPITHKRIVTMKLSFE
jgi:alpha-mannosidase